MNKLTLFLALVLLTVSNIFSQNRIDPQSIRVYQDTIVNFDDTTVFAKNWNDFMIGWNYGGLGRQFDQLMNSKFYLNGWEIKNNYTQDIDFTNRGNNHNWYLTISPLNQAYEVEAVSGNDMGVVGTQSIYYEPSIDVVTDDSFAPTSNHIEGAVFGFQDRHSGIVCSNGTATLSPAINTSQPVLSNVWPKNELKFWNRFYSHYHNLHDEL